MRQGFGVLKLRFGVRNGLKFDERLRLLKRGRRILRDGVDDDGVGGAWTRDLCMEGTGTKLGATGFWRLAVDAGFFFSRLSVSRFSSLSTIRISPRRSFSSSPVISLSSLSFRFFPPSRTAVSSLGDNTGSLGGPRAIRFRFDVG
jgi:hypothetical protein